MSHREMAAALVSNAALATGGVITRTTDSRWSTADGRELITLAKGCEFAHIKGYRYYASDLLSLAAACLQAAHEMGEPERTIVDRFELAELRGLLNDVKNGATQR